MAIYRGKQVAFITPFECDVTRLREALGFTNYPELDEATTPELIAQAMEFFNAFAIEFLAEHGAAGVSRNTLAIIDAMEDKIENGGAGLNIQFGNNIPEDTTKLWIKTAQPQNITVDYDINNGVESVSTLTVTFPYNSYIADMACGVVGTKVYLFGGSADSARRNTIRVFDTDTSTLSTLTATLPQAMDYMACGVVGTKVYLFGGGGSSVSNKIYAFDTETLTLSTLTATLPQAALGVACGVVGTKCYLFGGHNGSAEVNTIYVFDTETDAISTLTATLPQAARVMACGVVGTKVYLFGGARGSTSFNTIYAFDTETLTISTLTATLPQAAIGVACGVVGTKVYLFGGAGAVAYNTISVFDTTTETLTTLTETLPRTECDTACGVVGNRCYLFGGWTNTNIDKFTVTFPLDEGDVFIQEDMLKNQFTLIKAPNKVITGISAVYVGNENDEAEYAEALLYDDTSYTWEHIT